MAAPRFLIIIPAYNEQENLGRVLEGLLAVGIPADILVVNDGSQDRTGEIASGYPVHLITHPCNLGYGAALQTGFKYAQEGQYPYLIQFDSDGQHDPEDVTAIIEELKRGDADIVMGSRFLDGSPRFETGLMKNAGIRFFRMLIRRFTGTVITDPTSGLRGVSNRVFSFFAVRDRFPADFPDADILIQMLLMNFRIKEVPASMRQREAGVSMHAGWKPLVYMLQILLSIFVVLLRHKWAKKAV